MNSQDSVLPAGRERALLIVLMLVQFTTIVDFMIMMPLSSYLMTEMDIGTSGFGLLVSAYSLAAGVSALLAASLADRFDRRSALLATYAGLSLGTLACAVATGFYSLLAARAVAGVFGGVLASITFAIVGDIIPPHRRGRAMSIVMLAFSLSAVAGVPIGLFVAAYFGWRVPFAALAAICVVVWAAAWYLVPHVKTHLEAKPTGLIEGYRQLLVVPNHWWAFAVSALVMFAGFLVIPYIAPSLVANVGLGQADLVYVYLVGGAVTLVTRPWIGVLTDRHPHARVLSWLVWLSFIPVLLVTHTLPLSLPWQLAISGLFFMFVSGRFIPTSALITGATLPQMRGRLMAFNSAVQNLASGLAAFVAGAMMQTGLHGQLVRYDWVGYLSCFVGAASILAAYRVKAVS